MTKTDKIEIENLINSAREMKDYAVKMNGLYVDEKIANFAYEAKKDYINNKNYIKRVIQENLGLFFDLENFAVSTSGASTAGYSAMAGEPFGIRIKDTKLNVTAVLTDAKITKNTGYDVYFNVSDLSVLDIRWYTSDCADKENYRICSNWDLVDMPHDEVAEKPFVCQKSAKEWEKLYWLACATRAKNSQLVSRFKECLQTRISAFRASANENEKRIGQLKSVSTTYVKVDL